MENVEKNNIYCFCQILAGQYIYAFIKMENLTPGGY